jgi:hypothetical protein
MVKTEYKWYVKFRYSEKAKEIWKKSPNLLWRYKVISKRKKVGDFFKFFGLLTISELYLWNYAVIIHRGSKKSGDNTRPR